MIELKYKSWKDITIKVFNKIKQIEIPSTLTQEETLLKNIELLAVLCDTTEEEISNLRLDDFNKLLKKAEFLNEMPKVNLYDYYSINGNVYKVCKNLRELTTAQYVDFQTLSKEKDKNLSQILACFLIPKGKNYCEGYDITEVVEEINNFCNIVDARSVMFFFSLQFQTLTKVMLTYSLKQMKKQAKKMKDKTEIQEKMKELEENLTQVNNLLKNGIGFF